MVWGLRFRVNYTAQGIGEGASSLLLLAVAGFAALPNPTRLIWEFPKIGVACFGVLIIRILLIGFLYQGPLFSETPI